MWSVLGKTITMAEGDYGTALPAFCRGAELTSDDTVRFTFKTKMNGSVILQKDLTPTDNFVTLTFTEADSALFSVGMYVWSADWFQNGVFMCNIIPMGLFKVVDKA